MTIGNHVKLLNKTNMQTESKRFLTNDLFTVNAFYANGELISPYTLEYTESMITTGIYQILLVNNPEMRRRQIAIVADDCDPHDPAPHVIACIVSGNSYRNVRQTPNMVLGEKSFPGAVVLSNKIFNRFFDRVEKCIARGERITLFITDHMMKQTEVPHHWLEDPMHGCPTSNRHVEVDDEGNVSVFDGEELIKTFPSSNL